MTGLRSTASDGTAARPGADIPTAAASPQGRSDALGRNGSSKSGMARGRLGAGIVTIPPVPMGDPIEAILSDPRVPEGQRFCGSPGCNKPVGRGSDGHPGQTEGRCGNCGARFSFLPKLSRGDLVGGQYEVWGCIAHGGLGWIYLATDRKLHNRWVVLKGLINSGDADAMAAAEAEVRMLTKVQHPNIVAIYNFVEHPGTDGVPVGYIVMEYVGGTSLKQIRASHGGPLPPEQAVAYMIEIAPALGYLHSQGLAYCDFKPDNVMQCDEQLKLIDLGAVIAMDDLDSSIFGTRGYQAPEIAMSGPTPASDVYTVGRTLAVLVMDVPKENGRLVDRLPGPESAPVLARHESLHLAILRATDPNHERRFSSMEELADQLTGVLHEIVAAERGTVLPRRSTLFSPQRAVFGTGRDVPVDPEHVIAALSVPVVDPTDPGAALLATTSGTPAAQLEQALELAETDGDRSSLEVSLRLVRASLEMGDPHAARQRLAELDPLIRADWRAPWYRGQCALLEGEFDQAAGDFAEVLAMVPGELPPKLALAAVAELSGDRERAGRYYEAVWCTDQSYFSAGFGLARQRARAGDRLGAIAALDQVRSSSAHFTPARAAAIEVLLDDRTPDSLDEQTLLDAAARADALKLESAAARARTRLSVFSAALGWLRAGHTNTAARLLDTTFDESSIRSGMERCYRELARDTADTWERITLVERANAIRPRTRL
ncbi:MAG: tetratricopeptide repeat protein [Mycobacterium sp.]